MQMEHSGPADPGRQVQLMTLVLPAGDVETPGHATHEVKPGVLPYVPGLQVVQVLDPALSAYVPAPHETHCVDKIEGDVDPAGHATHEVIPGVFPYVPEGQAVQVLAPSLSAYVPASHTKHSFGATEARSPHAQQASDADME